MKQKYQTLIIILLIIVFIIFIIYLVDKSLIQNALKFLHIQQTALSPDVIASGSGGGGVQ